MGAGVIDRIASLDRGYESYVRLLVTRQPRSACLACQLFLFLLLGFIEERVGSWHSGPPLLFASALLVYF